MRLLFFFFILLTALLLPTAVGQGIGVSPDQLTLTPDMQATLWLTNPQPHPVSLTLQPGCDGITLSSQNVTLEGHAALKVIVTASSDAAACNSTLLVSLTHDAGNGLRLAPALELPLHLAATHVNLHWSGSNSKTNLFLALGVLIVAGGAYMYWRKLTPAEC